MLVVLVLAMVVFMVAAALTIDLARLHLTQTELRAATEAAAKAAAENLTRTSDPVESRRRGIEIAAANRVMERPLLLHDKDISFGRSGQRDGAGRFIFSPTTSDPNSVRVTGRRQGSGPSGAIPLFLGNYFNARWFDAQQTAIATYRPRDIVLVWHDADGRGGSRLREWQSALDILVNALRDMPVKTRVGMMSFSSGLRNDVPLTDDFQQIPEAVRRLPSGEQTKVSQAIRSGAEMFTVEQSPEFVERTMIVMVGDACDCGPDLVETAHQLAADGIILHTITWGADTDRLTMQRLAHTGRGRAFHADHGQQLHEIFRQIARSLSTMMTE